MKPTFTYREVKRSQIKTAEYNPRSIGESERKRLWAVLDQHGLVEPLVWNKRTGNLVGGHQRLAWLDSKQGAAGDGYRVPVAQIDIAIAQEKALNIALNNPKAQGQFDDSKLAALLRELGDMASHGSTGFDSAEVDAILDEASALLRPVDARPPPKMAWALVGIPLGRFGEISPAMEELAKVPGILLETTTSDHGAAADTGVPGGAERP